MHQVVARLARESADESADDLQVRVTSHDRLLDDIDRLRMPGDGYELAII